MCRRLSGWIRWTRNMCIQMKCTFRINSRRFDSCKDIHIIAWAGNFFFYFGNHKHCQFFVVFIVLILIQEPNWLLDSYCYEFKTMSNNRQKFHFPLKSQVYGFHLKDIHGNESTVSKMHERIIGENGVARCGNSKSHHIHVAGPWNLFWIFIHRLDLC